MNLKVILNEVVDKLKNGIMRTMSANALNKIIGMISSMIITRLLSQNDYGIWSYVLNLYSYLVLITGFGLIHGALQFGTELRGEDRANNFLKYCLKNGLIVDLGLITVVGIVLSLLDLSIADAKPFVVLILPFLLLEYIVSMGQIILRTQNRINEYAKCLNINTVLLTTGTCVGAFFGLYGTILGRYVAIIITIWYLAKLLHKDWNSIKNAGGLLSDEKKSLWHYSIFTGTSSAMNCLVYYIDVTLIAALIGSASEVGVYKVGTLIPNALQFIPNSIVIAILPTIIYNRKDTKWIKKNITKTYIALFLLNMVLVGTIIVFAPLIIKTISGVKYLDAVPVIRILALGYFVSGTFRGLSVNLLASFRRVYFGIFISITSCLTDVIFNYWFISSMGMIGAAYATLMVDCVTACLSFAYVVYLIKRGTINESN